MNRAFIAITLPREVRERLKEKQEEIKMLLEGDSVKWVEEENLHITLLFLGVVKNKEKLIEKLKKVDQSSFSVEIEEVCYFPEDKREAKMIWANVNDKEIKNLLEKIDDSLEITPHITLGRIRRWEWQKMSLEAVPDIEDYLGVSFKVESFSLIESKTRRKGPDYDIIEEFKLK
ncbi:MAG: RNA 2',3'-cyclic phosphodiesterase [Candidatus Pacebacteria bacterium]|nr:RNA 2',3'-cyclic phosphodiesterase [Candidatus Paceibacterota bacterium]